VTLLVSGGLALLVIYGFRSYGMGLFFLLPLFIGLSATVLYGYHMPISRKQAAGISLLTLAIFASALLVFAVEGIICIAMAAPIAMLLTWIGSLTGYAILSRKRNRSAGIWLLLMAAIPATAWMEKDNEPELFAVVTSMDIHASREEVWKHVIRFPQLKEPEELIFKAGIAYPVNATIEGKGPGAIRHCNFTTGSFVEPITLWNEPELLKFDVREQPAPMKELSFWNIDAPHLHDYFVSRQGQFRLIALPGGKTRLEGTTWYYHDIKPAFYWKLWSDHIIHKIHVRVLEHIKATAELKGSGGL
jgi:hypothetical protein